MQPVLHKYWLCYMKQYSIILKYSVNKLGCLLKIAIQSFGFKGKERCCRVH